ncbi:hypothetical protein LCGC14_0966920, partial [marine sediment metagenome]
PATYAVVTGTPAASPVPPATPIDAVVLAEVFVATSAGSITNNNIIRRAKELASLDDEDTSRSTNLENTTHAPVADITALKAIAPEERADNQTLLVKDDGTAVAALYRFDSSSTDTADGLTIVIPNAFSLGTAGRWFRLPVADAFDLAGIFVAKIGGSTPDYAGSAIRTALSDFENSGQEAALFIVREDMDFSGGDLTVSKPFKMVAQVEPGSSFYNFSFNGVDVLTLDPESTVDPGYVEAEFVGINATRGASGTGGIVFPLPSSLRLRFSRITDQRAVAAANFIQFTGSGTVELEATDFFPTASQSLIGGTFLTVTCRRCDIDDTAGTAFDSTTLELYLLEGTLFETDDFTNVTTLRVRLDGTSILAGKTQIPTGFTNLEVIGHDFWTPRFSTLGISFSDALNFNISGNLVLGPSVISLGATILTISRSDLVVTGTKAGSEGTRIEGTPGLTNDMIILTGGRIRLQGIVFRSSPSGVSAGATILGTGTSGLEIINCEFQAEGANNSERAILLGASGSAVRERNLIRDCWARSSPEGTPAFWKTIVFSLSGTGLIENCMVENFTRIGISSQSSADPENTGAKVSKCVVDMSSCTVTDSSGITSQGAMVSECRVRCPDLATNLDSARAIRLESSAGAFGVESGVVDNCQLSGEGAASTRRIGIGIHILSTTSLCKINGCSIRDFRKQGVKIEGDLNVVVHNTITSIDDGGGGGTAIETIITTGINNLVDANIETGTGGTPYIDNGATNHFDTANTDNTGNRSV